MSTILTRLTAALGTLMILQGALGLVFRDLYRDVEWIRATWYGNDWATLVIAGPLLLISRSMALSGSPRGLLLMLGVTGYAVYNYFFYLFGAALNVFFPAYVAGTVLAGITLIVALPHVDVGAIAGRFHPRLPERLLGGYFVFVGSGLSAVWVTLWAAFVFFGRPTPIEPNAFRLVAALDLCIMVPLLVAGGALMWRKRPWGTVFCGIGGVQASLYLLVLSVNSIIAIARGLATSPGELPVWGPLFVFTASATSTVILGIRGSLSLEGTQQRVS